MKIKKILLFLIPLLFLFPFGVFAKNVTFVYNGGQFICENDNCSSTSLGYHNYGGNNFYQYSIPYQSTYENNTVKYLALNGVNSIDTSNSDYLLINVITTNGVYISSAKFRDSGVYGYSLTSNYVGTDSWGNSESRSSIVSSYSTILKFDVSSVDSVSGVLQIYFTSPSDSFYNNIQLNLDTSFYLGQENDKVYQAIDKQTSENKKFYDNVLDTDTSDSQTKGSNFFKNYNSNSHGLSGIITAPLKFLQSLTGAKCSPLKFELPFVKKEVQLQCMKSIYQTHFGVFYTLWQTLTTGLIAYTVCLNFYKKIRDLQNPDNDKIEVLNL